MREREIWAVSDVHGHLGALLAAIAKSGVETDPGVRLVLLGDYIDRGPQSAEVLAAIKALAERRPDRVVALLGNHETDFLDWLDADDEDFAWLAADDELVTIRSFLDPEELAEASRTLLEGHDFDALASVNAQAKRALLARHRELIAWLRSLPRYFETPEQIFVHAGIEEDAGEDWKLATADEVLVSKFPPTFGWFSKTIVAGHVGTDSMHPDGSHGIHFDGRSHYYIDGSVEKTGVLNILKYTAETGRYEYLTAEG